LITYDSWIANIENVLQELNHTHSKLEFTIEEENNDSINFLDISITKRISKLGFNFHRKPTATDNVIHNESSHPEEHERAAI
jgi:hypothetical protein